MPDTQNKPLWTCKPPQGQQRTNNNRADNAAKKCRNKEKTQQAAAKKLKYNKNNAQVAALWDATNVSQAVETSLEEQITSLKGASLFTFLHNFTLITLKSQLT
jgi:uncharacterized cupin superfamily protein